MIEDGALYAEMVASAGKELSPGALVRELRRRAKLSLKDVAEAIGDGVHFTTVGKIETGKMQFTADWGYEFAKLFGVTADFFFRPYLGSSADVKSVPVYSYAASALHNRSQLVPSHYIGFVTEHDDLFAVMRPGSPDIISDQPLNYIVLTPRIGPYCAGSIYLLDVDGYEDALVGLCRGAHENLHFIPWPEHSRDFIWPRSSPVRALGRVLQVQRLIERD